MDESDFRGKGKLQAAQCYSFVSPTCGRQKDVILARHNWWCYTFRNMFMGIHDILSPVMYCLSTLVKPVLPPPGSGVLKTNFFQRILSSSAGPARTLHICKMWNKHFWGMFLDTQTFHCRPFGPILVSLLWTARVSSNNPTLPLCCIL